MKHRSETLSIYYTLAKMIRTQFDTSVHAFRVDSVGEYISGALR